jgi:hypothetical protein
MLYAAHMSGSQPEVSKRQKAKEAARTRLSHHLSGSTFEGNKIVQLRHVCRVGCHNSEDEARDSIWIDLCLLLFNTHVVVPALNRWLKLYRPLSFWHVATCLGILPQGFRTMSLHRPQSMAADVEAWIGMETDESYKQKEHARVKKAAAWLLHSQTSTLQGVALACILPLAVFMGRLFDDSKFTSDKFALEFCLPYRSPARRTMQRYFHLMSDMRDPCWQSVRGPGPWLPRTLRLVGTTCVFIMASLYYRCILPFLRWPWLLGIVGCPEATDAEKREATLDAKDTSIWSFGSSRMHPACW